MSTMNSGNSAISNSLIQPILQGVSGWWLENHILKNDGLRQFGVGWHPIYEMGKYSSHVWNHQPDIVILSH